MKRLLIVEDDDDISFLLSETVVDFGYEANTVANAQDLTQLLNQCSLHKKPYDVIFMDVTIPGIPFEQLYAKLKRCEYCRDARLYLLSGRHDLKEIGKEFAVDGILTKPFDLKTIEGVLHS